MLPHASHSLRFTLPTFEGPLDLLLHLIRDNQVDIHDIPIAEIARQYMDVLATWEAMDLAVAGEYIVMAATLLEIKSRMLLPAPPPAEAAEEEDPRLELVERLEEYERFRGLIETLRGWEELRRAIYFRSATEIAEDYMLPIGSDELSAAALAAALERVLAAAGVDDTPVTAIVPRRRVSLKVKMAEVLRRVRAAGKPMPFGLLLSEPIARADVVVTFLAVLELLRLHRLRVRVAPEPVYLVVRPAGEDVP